MFAKFIPIFPVSSSQRARSDDAGLPAYVAAVQLPSDRRVFLSGYIKTKCFQTENVHDRTNVSVPQQGETSCKEK
jgi:hypothetical protein